VTPPVFDAEALERFLERTTHVRIPLVAAIRPLDSLRHAEYLANEVPNVDVPPSIIDRMRRAGSPEAEAAEGVEIARELAGRLRSTVQGLQIGGPRSAVLSVMDGL
jgi:5,10-methylenetetrahydrofolate reductase